MRNSSLLGVTGVLMSATLLCAEQQSIEVSASDSGRLYAYTTHGDCCDLDSWDSNPGSTLWTETCSTMGGYCSGGKDVALLMFPVPDLPEDSELLEVRIKVNKQSGASGAATLYMRGFQYESHGMYSAQQTYSSANHNQSVVFSGSMAHSFALPISHFLDPYLEPYVAIAIYRSSSLHMINTGFYAPSLEFVVETDVAPPCPSDVNGDGYVDGTDLSLILGHWGMDAALYDLDGSGLIDGADLAIILGAWGECPIGE